MKHEWRKVEKSLYVPKKQPALVEVPEMKFFVDQGFADQIMDKVKKKKKLDLVDNVRYLEEEEGKCVQMMHLGSYDDEPESFRIMEDFCAENGLVRKSKVHREIYLSDPRKVAPDKLKTVLRFQVEKL